MDKRNVGPKVAIFNDTRPYGHYGCDLVMAQLTALLECRSISPVYFWPVRKDWRPHAAGLPRAPHIDAIIVNGEGSIHRSATRKRAVFLSELARFAKDVSGVPAFLINATVHEIDQATANNLRSYEKIYVRERGSCETLSAFGIDSSVAPDLCISLDWRPTPGDRTRVLGTDSVFEDVGKQIRTLCGQNGWPFVRMEHKRRLLRRELLSPQHMLSSLRHWAGRRERIFLDEVGRSRLVITGRFHAVVFCLLTRTPFIAVESNTPKISSVLMDVFGNTDRLVNPGDLKARVQSGWQDFTPEEEAAIQTYVADGNGRIASMMDQIARFISGHSRPL